MAHLKVVFGTYNRPHVKSSAIQENIVTKALSRYLRPYHATFSVIWQSFAKAFVRLWLHHAVF